MNNLDRSTITNIVQNIDTRERANLAVVCKGWRSTIKSSWHYVHFQFTTPQQLQKQLAWLAQQLEECPWILQAASFQCRYRLGDAPSTINFGAYPNLAMLDFLSPGPVKDPHADLGSNMLESLWRPPFSLPIEVLQQMGGLRGLRIFRVGIFRGSCCKRARLSPTNQSPRSGSTDPSGIPLNVFATMTRLEQLHIFVEHGCGLWLSSCLTDLQRLHSLDLRGAGAVREERPGVLSDVAQHLTKLYLQADLLECQSISSPRLVVLTIICPFTPDLPVGKCPELRKLLHSARHISAQQAAGFPKLESLADMVFTQVPHMTPTFVMGLWPLSSLKTLHLSQYRPDLRTGFEEMSGLIRLQCLKLHMDFMAAPGRMFLSLKLQACTDLQVLEIRAGDSIGAFYRPSFEGVVRHLTALRSLYVECCSVHSPIASPSLQSLELSAPHGSTMKALPLFAECPSLTHLQLRNMPPVGAAHFRGLQSLKELSLTFSYAETHDAIAHDQTVERLMTGLPASLPALEALQVVATRANVSLGFLCRHKGWLQHLALVCLSTKLDDLPNDDWECCPPSMQLAMRAREHDAIYLLAKSPGAASNWSDSAGGVDVYKFGKPHAMDLDREDVLDCIREDVALTKHQ